MFTEQHQSVDPFFRNAGRSTQSCGKVIRFRGIEHFFWLWLLHVLSRKVVKFTKASGPRIAMEVFYYKFTQTTKYTFMQEMFLFNFCLSFLFHVSSVAASRTAVGPQLGAAALAQKGEGEAAAAEDQATIPRPCRQRKRALLHQRKEERGTLRSALHKLNSFLLGFQWSWFIVSVIELVLCEVHA